MNVSPIAMLSNFKENLIGTVTHFINNPKGLVATNYEEISDLAKWLQQEKYINFTGMLVPVPPGLKVTALEHVQKLENVWSVVGGIMEGVLVPVDRQLAAFTHDLPTLTLPIGFRFKEFKYPLKNVNPDDLIDKLAGSFDSTTTDMRPIEKVFRSANEIDIAYNRAKALHNEVDKKTRAKLDRIIESISASADILAEAKMNPTTATEVIKLLEMASSWVSLFGLFMKQVNEITEALNAIGDKLSKLKQNQKK